MLRFLTSLIGLLIFLNHSGCALLIRTPAISSPAKPTPPDQLRGVFHVHSEFSGDSDLSLMQIIKAGRRADLDFIVVTDHNTKEGEIRYQEKDYPSRPVLIFAEEITTEHGHVTALGAPEFPNESLNSLGNFGALGAPEFPNEFKDSRRVVEWIHDNGGYAILAHPVSDVNPWRNWFIEDYDGLEIYNFGHTFYGRNKLNLALKLGFMPPGYFLKTFHRTPEEGLKLWNKQSAAKQKVAFGASDAHIHWRWFGFALENLLLYLQSVTHYVQAGSYSPEEIVDALGKGKSYLAFEALGDASHFRFLAEAQGRSYSIGSTLPLQTRPVFNIQLPALAEIRIIRQGAILLSRKRAGLSYAVKEAGAYRVEVYRKGRLWIVTNVIHVEP